MKTFFVTGGAGFIGGNFILNLMKTGQAKVLNYDKLTYAGNLDTLSSIEGNPHYTFEQGDICDKNRLKNLFEYDVREAPLNKSLDCLDDVVRCPTLWSLL